MEDRNSKTRQYEFFSESRDVANVKFSCFVGIDLHKTTVTLRAVDPSEKVISSLRTNTKCVKKIEDWLNELPRPRWMAVEAVSFTEWFIDRYRDGVDRIDIADATAQTWILGHGNLLKEVQRESFANFIDILSLIERQRESWRRKIIFANRSEAFSARIFVLKSIPGIDEIWACIIAAEVGPFDRFPNADTIEFWAGLTPDNKESAGRTQSGRITQAGSATLRWALCQAAMALCRSDVRQDAIRQRLVKRVGKVKANVAMGRRLLRIIYAMMRDGTLYERSEPTDRLRRSIKKANYAKRNKREVA